MAEGAASKWRVRRRPLEGRYLKESDREQALRMAFEDGVITLARIAELFDISRSTLGRLSKAGGWRRSPTPVLRDAAHGQICPGLSLCPARTDSVARLNRELSEAIRSLESAGAAEDTTEREKRARTLNSLTRSLEKVSALDGGLVRAGAGQPEAAEDGEAPYDIEQLRRELTERVHRLRQARDDAGTDGGAERPGTDDA